MSSSRRNLRFLLDENVRVELWELLTKTAADVVRAPRGWKDRRIAARSLRESRIVVTNDEDFTQFPEDAIYGVIWLRIPQNDPVTLIRSFSKLLASREPLKGQLVVLLPDRWEAIPLPIEIKLEEL